MNKRFLLWAIIGLAAGGMAVLVYYNHSQKFWDDNAAKYKQDLTDQELADAARKFHGADPTVPSVFVPLDLKRPVRLAIGSLGFANDEQNRRVSDLVLAELSGAQGLNLVERQSLDTALREMSLSLSGLIRAKDAVRVGKLLKADWFLLGTEAKISGTNSLVIRLVDARTGIFQDAGVFPTGQPPTQLAGDIAAFVRQTRQNAATAKPRVYLAIGAFEDLSANNRLASFPTQLRSYLIAAYQGGSVTLLEREYVDTLLQEVRLDLAGLTEDGGTKAPQPIQSAFWLVTGRYQSYETTNLQIELNLDVQRIFGATKHLTVRGLPGEVVDRQIKMAIDEAMIQNAATVIPTRMSEVRAQMAVGKEFAELGAAGLFWPEDYQNLDQQETARRRRNAEEAIRAFKTVLLLEPTNHEAKLYWAACLRKQTINRVDEARNYYREILEEPIQDRWTGQAQQALQFSFRWSSPEEKAQWFETALRQNTNSSLATFYRQEADGAESEITIKRGEGTKAQELAEERLFGAIRSTFEDMKTGQSKAWGDYGMSDFAETFGTNYSAAGRRLAELYPKMKIEFPEIGSRLLEEAITHQTDTNTPLIAEMERILDWQIEHPKEVFRGRYFNSESSIFKWSMDKKLYPLAMKYMERKRSVKSATGGFDDQAKIALGLAYMGGARWKDAMEIFESFSNRPVKMHSDGPWGAGWTTVFPGKWEALCCEKLNLPHKLNPQEFDMGKPLLCLCTPSTFATDQDGLWIGIGGQLLHLDFDLKTNLVIKLPMNASAPITALSLNSSGIWIGTAGEGLIEYDKSSRKCQHFTVNDGLMMNIISSMHLAGDVLWIGYGNKSGGIAVEQPGGGGLGSLNLSTHKFTSFTPSIEDGVEAHKYLGGNLVVESTDKPTRRAIQAIVAGPKGEVWFATAYHPLRRYRVSENVWDGYSQLRNSSCLAADTSRLFAGQFWNFQGGGAIGSLGVSIWNSKDGQWRGLKGADGLPSGSVTTLTLDGDNLWVGGMGYIALVDPLQDKVLKFAYVKASTVDRIQIGGGYVWAQFDWHLYRTRLRETQ